MGQKMTNEHILQWPKHKQFRYKLEQLIEWGYAAGQAFYRKDKFGSSEDEDQEWEDSFKPEFDRLIEEFCKEYGPDDYNGCMTSLR